MDLSKISIKKIRELIVFTALLVVALWKFDMVLGVLKTIWGIIFPFILGGAIAFLTNVPMSFLERTIFKKAKKENKIVKKLSRPISLLLTVVLVVGNVWCDSAAYTNNGNFDDKHRRFYSAYAKLDSRIFP